MNAAEHANSLLVSLVSPGVKKSRTYRCSDIGTANRRTAVSEQSFARVVLRLHSKSHNFLLAIPNEYHGFGVQSKFVLTQQQRPEFVLLCMFSSSFTINAHG